MRHAVPSGARAVLLVRGGDAPADVHVELDPGRGGAHLPPELSQAGPGSVESTAGALVLVGILVGMLGLVGGDLVMRFLPGRFVPGAPFGGVRSGVSDLAPWLISHGLRIPLAAVPPVS